MKLSIVSTLYYSCEYIDEFYERISIPAREIAGDDYEIIFINDGSPDEVWRKCLELVKIDKKIALIDLARNFGHHKAMMVGLSHAVGDRVFLIDCDLEERPEWLSEFYSQMRTTGADVIYGVQVGRKGKWFERVSGKIYYKLFFFLTGQKLPESVVTARLMTRRFLKCLIQHGEREMFLGGLFLLTGFQQLPIEVRKYSTSETTYSLKMRFSLLVNSITSFSSLPLTLIFYTGFIISTLAGLNIGYLIVRKFFFSAPLSGWTSLIASIWFLGGVMILFLGVIGIYLSKVFIEVKQRPNTIIREVINGRQY